LADERDDQAQPDDRPMLLPTERQHRGDALLSSLMPANQRRHLLEQWEKKAHQKSRATQTHIEQVGDSA